MSNSQAIPATLAGKVALVTGGSRSLGAAIAKRLAAQGAHVALTYSASPDQAQQVVAAIEAAGGKALAIKADASNLAAVQAAVERTVSAFGQLDILVNNAGIATIKPLNEVTEADFDHIVNVNVKGMYFTIQAAARHLRQGGRIINIGSINSERVPFSQAALYVLSKAAVAGLTKGLSRDLGSRGITINNVMPGPINTDMNPDSGAFADSMRTHIALERYAQPDEVADVVAYLASPGSGYITGADLAVDGGFAA